MGDDEFSGFAKALQRIAQLLRFWDRQISRSHPHEYALYTGVAGGRVEREYDIHDRQLRLPDIEKTVRRLIVHGFSQIELQHHVRRHAVPGYETDADQHDDEQHGED